MATRKGGKDQNKAPRKTPDRRDQPCKAIRLGLIVGDPSNADLDAAAQWLIARAGVLGGPFRIWHSRRSADPLASFKDMDINGGVQPLAFTEYFEHPHGKQPGYGDVLADMKGCRGRIEELVIVHHGSAVNEAVLGKRLVDILLSIRVPVCRVVWWSCNAAVSLEAEQGKWTDQMMRNLGKIASCRPCGCTYAIELVWPTNGKCYLAGVGPNDPLQTNDGKVNKASWGYRQPDGSLSPDYPMPSGSTVEAPTDRDPPYGQAIPAQPGTVLGLGVTQKS